MNDQPRLESIRSIVDEFGRREGGPSSVLTSLGLRADLVTMFDPIDRNTSKSIVEDAGRALSTKAKGPALKVPLEVPAPVRSAMER